MSNGPRLTLLGSQDDRLRQFLGGHLQGHERAAAVLFRRLNHHVAGLADSDRYIAVEVIPFDDAWITSSSEAHVAFDMRPLRELFRRCEDEGLVFGFAHNHPTDYPEFSGVDVQNELALLSAISNRNGIDTHIVALLLTQGGWKARVRGARRPEEGQAVRHTAVLGARLQLYGYAVTSEHDDFDSRQAAAFGDPFVSVLRSLRIGVVGSSGTGSPTITLLARAGAGEILTFDRDALDKSNLNRVRGARRRDVGTNKAVVLRNFVNELGLPTVAACIEDYVDASGDVVDALASCDIVFGCTDDEIGRECITAALYAYLLVYIDVGLGGYVALAQDGQAVLRSHHGRVSVTLPEFGECLFCQGVISAKGIQYQYAKREKPAMSADEAKERYLEGGGEGAPGVGPFTSATADFGVATLFDLIRPYRRLPPGQRRDQFTIDFVGMELSSKEPKHDAECPYCGTREFLLLSGRYRLNRPALGMRLVHV